MTAFTSPLEICVPSAIARLNGVNRANLWVGVRIDRGPNDENRGLSMVNAASLIRFSRCATSGL